MTMGTTLPAVTEMTTEHLPNPVGVGVSRPRFSWKVASDLSNQSQTAFQIRAWENDASDRYIWETGKIDSPDQILVEYAGEALKSGTLYSWQVRIWESSGRRSGWSEVATFRTAILDPDQWQARWIRTSDQYPGGSYFRSSIDLTDVSQAALYVSARGNFERGPDDFGVCCEEQFGLARGMYVPWVNGNRVGDAEYESQPVDSRVRSYYRTWDVTEWLVDGANVVGIETGEDSDVICQLVVTKTDGKQEVLGTSADWKSHRSATSRAERYNGEIHDFRREIDGWNECGPLDEDWSRVVETGSAGRMTSAPNEPMRVVKTHEPVSVTNPVPGVFVYDFGQNITGRTRIRSQLSEGQRVHLKHGERLKNGRVDNEITGAEQTTTVIGDGREIDFGAQFTYAGFRWVEVSGLDDCPDVLAEEIHSDVVPAGTFVSDHDLLNRLHVANRQTQVNGLHGVPEDTPTREKRGWMADGHLAAEATMNNRSMAAFYTKWLTDIRDATQDSGRVPDIVPVEPSFNWESRSDPAWAAATVLLPLYMWKYHRDIHLVRDQYPFIKRWLEYVETTTTDFLVTHPSHTWGNDWLGIEETDSVLFRSCFYFWSVQTMELFAGLLGNSQDRETFARLKSSISRAINREFFDGESSYGPSQFANAFPLMLGLVPKGSVAAVSEGLKVQVRDDADRHFTGGLPGIKYIPDALELIGENELILDVVDTTDFPGWGYMLEEGPGTIWESWQGEISLDHPMFTCIDRWLYSAVAGIDQTESSVAFEEMVFWPKTIGPIRSASATRMTPYGRSAITWSVDDGGLRMEVSVPFGATARVVLPRVTTSSVCVGGVPLQSSNQIIDWAENEESVEVRVGSGEYCFTAEVLSIASK